jgi:glycosyltransferase involved in cell wall biosynthesis
VLRPRPVFARSQASPARVRKWLGYVAKFVLFPFALWREAKSYDLIHICDHSNSMYVHFLRGQPHMVTCHDLLAIRSALGEIPANPTGWSGRILQRAIRRGLERAQCVACVSEKTREDLLRLTRRDPESTPCVYNGLNYPYRPMERIEAQERVRQLLAGESAVEVTKPFLVHVGGNQWYKNRLGVLEVFARLRDKPDFRGYRLIMVGKPFTAVLRNFIASHDLQADVVEFTGVANEDIRALYTLAEGLVFPSLEEGFGWPIIEAQACGCPVFTSNRPPMNEVAGDAAGYFDPGDPIVAAALIAESGCSRASLAERGIANATRFSAGRMLGEYREAYLRVSESRGLAHSRGAGRNLGSRLSK